jgi:hypothetical protein
VLYLAGWARDAALVLQRANRVLATAHHLIAAVDRRLGLDPEPPGEAPTPEWRNGDAATSSGLRLR